MAKLTKAQLKEQASSLGLSFNTKTTVSELESMIASASTVNANPSKEEEGEY